MPDIINADPSGGPLEGTEFGDIINGSDVEDQIVAGGGRDKVNAGDGDDFVSGGANRDTLDGGEGNDTLEGNGSDDKLMGKDGDDSLDGGAGNDKLIGGAGADTIRGGDGDDMLWGDETKRSSTVEDADVFVFDSDDGNDRVMDFQDDIDTIFLEGSNGTDFTVTDVKGGNVLIEYGSTTILVYGMSQADIMDDISF